MPPDEFNFGENIPTGLTPVSSTIEPTNPSFRDLSTGSLTSQNITFGTRVILLRAGDSLEFAIKSLPSTGGIINLAAGTHTVLRLSTYRLVFKLLEIMKPPRS